MSVARAQPSAEIQGWRSGRTSLACAGRRPATARRCAVPVTAGLFDDLFNYGAWAPKSAQRWRLQKMGNDREGAGATSSISEESVEVLNQRLADARQAEPGRAWAAGAPKAAAEAAVSSPAAAAAGATGEDQPSFLASTDNDLAHALNERIGLLGGGGGGGGEEGEVLTGAQLRELIYSKYGKHYDVSFVRRDLPLGKVLVCLNVMWVHLEQRSFPMTEEEFNEKMDSVAFYLNAWDQQQRVIDYLRAPAKPRKGMPSRPVVGTAISIQLDPSQQTINEFFSQGAQ